MGDITAEVLAGLTHQKINELLAEKDAQIALQRARADRMESDMHIAERDLQSGNERIADIEAKNGELVAIAHRRGERMLRLEDQLSALQRAAREYMEAVSLAENPDCFSFNEAAAHRKQLACAEKNLADLLK